MTELSEARKTINEVDQAMAELFERRMAAVREVIAYKMREGLPIFDPAREQEVIENNSRLIQDEELKPYYREFLIAVMTVSKNYQEVLRNSAES